MTQPTITITDKQAAIIGREIGESFFSAFWQAIQDGNRHRAVTYTAEFFLDRLGAAIGKSISLVVGDDEG